MRRDVGDKADSQVVGPNVEVEKVKGLVQKILEYLWIRLVGGVTRKDGAEKYSVGVRCRRRQENSCSRKGSYVFYF